MGLRGAMVVVVGLVVGLMAVVAVAPGRDPVVRGVAVPVPPVGSVVTVEAPGRTPAFVASTEEGVRAFLGFAPHSGLPLAWCPSSGVFIEPVGSSWFDIAGDYLFGPSPGGLWPLAVEVVDGEAIVSDEVGVPAGRLAVPEWAARLMRGVPLGPEWRAGTPPDGLLDGQVDPCMDSEGAIGGLWAPVSAVPGPVPLAAVVRDRAWSLVVASVSEEADGHSLVDASGVRVPVSEESRVYPWEGELEVLVRGLGREVMAIPTFRPGWATSRWCGRGTVSSVVPVSQGASGHVEVRLGLEDALGAAQGCGYGTFASPPAGLVEVVLDLSVGTGEMLLVAPLGHVFAGPPDGPNGVPYPLDPLGMEVLVRGGPDGSVDGVYAPIEG